MGPSPARLEVEEFEHLCEDLPDVGHVEQHEWHPYYSVQYGRYLTARGPGRQITIA